MHLPSFRFSFIDSVKNILKKILITLAKDMEIGVVKIDEQHKELDSETHKKCCR